MINQVQIWNPDDWELFSLGLLQNRHGPLNVQKIPAAHKGDYGIDYYCTNDLVAYQCYSVEEPVDIATRAERQKTKITKDLSKLLANYLDIAKLFLGVPIKHWILLAPLHDSKEVNLHCAKKTGDMRETKCPVLDPLFEVKIQDTSSFPCNAIAAGMSSLSTITLAVPNLSQEELDKWAASSSNLLANATKKMRKRASPDQVQAAVAQTIRDFLQGNAMLDALRTESPDLHEKIMSAIKSRARRLQFAGSRGGPTPSAVLHTEFDSLISAIAAAVPRELSVSEDSYRPEKEGFEIGFETSASDAIRLKWAYQLSLLELANEKRTNHPNLLVFDEPRQQSSSEVSFESLLRRASASKQTNQQVIFSTSENLETIQLITRKLDCNELVFTGYLLRKLQ
ncbi:hypothetical protein ACQR1W_08730 [Bradyrhizobium sp. HKCCYLS1011]|uniref:hypothetical protein n=1 Tax=Bradyrhizobium sp. HKCCYLS1011 TaxID=3420733 RepID=UPI003EBDA472